MKSKTTTRTTVRSSTNHIRHSDTSNAREHYLREKARRAKRARPDSELMAAAKREYLALLEAEAAKGKGGRPKKKAAKVVEHDEFEGDEDEPIEE